MARDKFITDNLINIREQLHPEYTGINQHKSDSLTGPAQDSGKEIHLDLKNPAPGVPGGSVRSAEREYNEFAGLIQHELAAAKEELEKLRLKNSILENYNSHLTRTADLLQQLQVLNSAEFFREFDRLRITHFRASGTASAHRNQEQQPLPERPQTAPQQAAGTTVLLPAAVLLASVLICLTLLLIFA